MTIAGSRGGHARAFTLLEMIVVATVASVIFLLLTRWVLTLGTISENGLSQAAAARGTAALDTAVAADLGQATRCDPAGTPIRALTGTVLEIYLDGSYAVGGHHTFLARWQVAGTRLTRTLYPVDPARGLCDPAGAGYGTRVIADGLRPHGAVFTGLAAGADAGQCEVTAQQHTDQPTSWVSTGPGCAADAVTLTVTVTPQGADGGRDTLTRTYPIATVAGPL